MLVSPFVVDLASLSAFRRGCPSVDRPGKAGGKDGTGGCMRK
jgi:hypothetical protein